LQLPPGSGNDAVAIGLYNPDTNARLPVVLDGLITDRLLLTQLDLK
jgi:hypothetical protein